MANVTALSTAKAQAKKIALPKVQLPIRTPVECPVSVLLLDLTNPRLQTGEEVEISTEHQLIETLVEIAALDELVLSICTNGYLNLEPLIVHGADGGPYTVLEGNRRLASIRLIQDPAFAAQVGIRVPTKLRPGVQESLKNVLVYRVAKLDDAREFIGFKHINGPQRWDAYAKAKYVTTWYKSAKGRLTIDEIADKMGDNNNTLRAYIYAVLILEQAAAAKVWSLDDRPTKRGRFAFSHLYTAITRLEYQEFLGLTDGWSSTPTLEPIKKKKLKELGEVLQYLYGTQSGAKQSLIRSQNPDLKDLGLAIVNPRARVALQQGQSLDRALDELKEPASAFYDSLVAAKIRLDKSIALISKYTSGKPEIDDIIDELFEQVDILKTMNSKKRARSQK